MARGGERENQECYIEVSNKWFEVWLKSLMLLHEYLYKNLTFDAYYVSLGVALYYNLGEESAGV